MMKCKHHRDDITPSLQIRAFPLSESERKQQEIKTHPHILPNCLFMFQQNYNNNAASANYVDHVKSPCILPTIKKTAVFDLGNQF